MESKNLENRKKSFEKKKVNDVEKNKRNEAEATPEWIPNLPSPFPHRLKKK